MPVNKGLNAPLRVWKTFEVRYQVAKKFEFRYFHVVSLRREVRLHLSIAFESQFSSLCIRFALTLRREVRLHLSIAFESQLSSLCIRFALTLHLLSEAASGATQMKKQIYPIDSFSVL